MNKLIVEPSPHIRSTNTTDKIMLRVIIALLPALAMSVYIFGVRALLLSAVCVIACMVFESLYRRIVRKDKEIDPSPAVTGLLLAFCLPVSLPYHIAIIGCFVAIVVVKQFFGGLGQNFANPAITARIVLMLSFTSQMTEWTEPVRYLNEVDAVTKATGVDGISIATPLALEAGDAVPSMMDLFMGFHPGSLGETCVCALLIGFIFLLITKVIRVVIPVAFIGTVVLGSLLAGADVGVQLLSGGLIIGAVYMATDYATTPVSMSGKLIFGIGCGLITIAIRLFADMPEGVSFAILIMNILNYYIDKATFPRAFGAKREPLFFKKKEGN